MAFEPTGRADVETLAIVSFNATVPNVVVPAVKVTLPKGSNPDEEVTVAVKVTLCPDAEGLTEDVSVVVVGAGFTTFIKRRRLALSRRGVAEVFHDEDMLTRSELTLRDGCNPSNQWNQTDIREPHISCRSFWSTGCNTHSKRDRLPVSRRIGLALTCTAVGLPFTICVIWVYLLEKSSSP